jgi:hypothetical protein
LYGGILTGERIMKTLTVDGCSICQLKCVKCPVSQMGYKNTIGNGWLSYPDFCKLIEDNPGVKHIEFDNFGELFLNPDLPTILTAAYHKDIILSCAGGVNLNTVSNHLLKILVLTRFQYLNISIDGASQDTYGKYRVGGNYAQVIHNIECINYYKRRLGTPYPILQWQFVVFGHNEHEIRKARQTAQGLGMRFYPKMNWNSTYSPIENIEQVKTDTGWDTTSREEHEKKHGTSYMRQTCMQLWDSPRLSWDLSITGCCWNVWERFTNETLVSAKYDLMNRTSGKPTHPCAECEIYHDILDTGKYLSDFEIKKYMHKKRLATELKYWLWRLDL